MFDLSVSALAPCGKVCNSSKQTERVRLRAFSMTSISCGFTLNELAHLITSPVFICAFKNHDATTNAIAAMATVSKGKRR
tara:strand:- start:48 stop:287 length:240 start_codon:yes stop_codon:yes gene_type:complete